MYWSDFYSKTSVDSTPSSFALTVIHDLTLRGLKGCRVLDVGCGNGRDSKAFHDNGFDVTSVDVAFDSNFPWRHVKSDVKDIPDAFFEETHVLYLRFFLHAITASQQAQLFIRIKSLCALSTLVYIETRSANDPMLLKDRISETESCFTHYRRFQTCDELRNSISDFHVLYISEVEHASPQGEDDPTLLRCCFAVSLNTAAKQSHVRSHDLNLTVSMVKNVCADIILAYGTLLGHVRDGQCIEGDDDVDFWTFDMKKSTKCLVRAGFQMFEDKPHFKAFVTYCGIQCDLYLLVNDNNDCIDRWSFWGETNQFLRIPQKLLLPVVHSMPSRPTDLVRYLYGPYFRTPLRKKIDYTTTSDETGRLTVSVPYMANEFPIWIYWDKGIEHAPELVKRCVKSWQRRHTNVHVLDDVSYPVLLSQKSNERLCNERVLRRKCYAHAKSDILRLEILSEYGGLWVDATVLCTTPVHSWLPSDKMFLFQRSDHVYGISSWFLYAPARHPVILKWSEALDASSEDTEYFKIHKVFHTLRLIDDECRSSFESMAYMSSSLNDLGPHSAQKAASTDTVWDEERHAHLLDSAIKVHKLTYKTDNGIFQHLLKLQDS